MRARWAPDPEYSAWCRGKPRLRPREYVGQFASELNAVGFVFLPPVLILASLAALGVQSFVPLQAFLVRALVACLAALPITFTAQHVLTGPLRRRVRSCRSELCAVCRHDLRQSPEAGACPECGDQYRKAWLWRCWWPYADSSERI